MRMNEIKEGFSSIWDSLAEGWTRLRRSAADAITRFTPDATSAMPASAEVDDESYMPTQAWSMLGGDVFEDDRRIVVRLEIPGMDKKDLHIEARDDTLVVSGEKHFAHEGSGGRYRVLQCAYGSFRRVVPLPARVRPEEATARYRDGVLRVELAKLEPGRPKRISVEVV